MNRFKAACFKADYRTVVVILSSEQRLRREMHHALMNLLPNRLFHLLGTKDPGFFFARLRYCMYPLV